jgi:hypothetical protein
MFAKTFFTAAALSLALAGAARADYGNFARLGNSDYVVNPYSPALDFGRLNMRDGQGVYHYIVGRIPAGERVRIVGVCLPPDDGESVHRWCNVLWHGRVGWVSMGGLEYRPLRPLY